MVTPLVQEVKKILNVWERSAATVFASLDICFRVESRETEVNEQCVGGWLP